MHCHLHGRKIAGLIDSLFMRTRYSTTIRRIYSDAAIMKAKPQVAAFINFYLTYVDEEIADIGYFPASDAALNGARQTFLDAQGQ